MNTLFCGDNYEQLTKIPSESVDLIYLDPPFFSNRNYEVIWGDEAEVRSFEDRWEGGIQVYIAWMRERVMEMHRVLKPTGSFYLHCDWHASHYLKQMLDSIFGENHFQNEVIWYYKGAGISPKRWGRRHDNIFFYTKGKEWTFNADEVRDEYAAATVERFKHSIGNVRDGRDYGQQSLNPKGKHPDDVWEISILAPSARDRLGYPTQKPPALLEKIIKASSNKGDIVLDPFAGCGTAIVAAQKLGRKWIGIDISPTAIGIMKLQVKKAGAWDVEVIGMPVTIEELKALKPFEFQNWAVIDRFNGTLSPRKSGDMGIDGYTFFLHEPIQVKQSEHVGRNVIDNFESAIVRDGKNKGHVVAFSFTKDAREEVARAKAKDNLDITLHTTEELLEDQTKLKLPTGQLIPEIIVPKSRAPEDLPSVEELLANERKVAV